jgi:hypothetical protein
LFFVGFVVLLWNPQRPAPIAIGAVLVMLLALSSAFGLLLAPLAVVRVIALGRDRGRVIPLAFLAGAVVEVVAMAVAHNRQTYHTFLPGWIGRSYATVVAGQGFFGSGQQPAYAVVIAVLAALVLVAVSGRLRPAGIAALVMAYSVGCYAVLMVLSNDAGSGRYQVPPFLLLAYAVTVLLDAGLPDARQSEQVHVAGQRRLASPPRVAALVVCAVLAWCMTWTVADHWNDVGDPRRQQPTWSGALATARTECGHGAHTVRIPITPKGWSVPLTCAQVGSSHHHKPHSEGGLVVRGQHATSAT